MGKKENWKETGNSASWARVRNLIFFILFAKAGYCMAISLLELNSLTYNT